MAGPKAGRWSGFQSRRVEGQSRCLGVMPTSQALRAHRVIRTDDDGSDSITTQHGQRLAPSPHHRHHRIIVTTTTRHAGAGQRHHDDNQRQHHHDADRRPIADGTRRSRHRHSRTDGAVSNPLTDWLHHRSRPSSGHVAATNEEPSPFPNAGDGSSPHEMGGIASG